jgi:hypothetical protein
MTPMVDRITGAALILDHAEHDIHDGRSFTVFHQSVAALPTAVGEETAVAFLIQPLTTSTKRIHMIVTASADDESTFEIREAPTIVVNQGTRKVALNRDRASTETSDLIDREVGVAGGISTFNVAEAAAANLAGGTILHSEAIAIGGAAPFGGVANTLSRAQREFVLNPGTEYVVILTNLTVNDTVHRIQLDWSEDTPADFAN